MQLVSAIPELWELDSKLIRRLAARLTTAICDNRPDDYNFGQEGPDFRLWGMEDLVVAVASQILRKARHGHEYLLPVREDVVKVTACSCFSYFPSFKGRK